MATSRKEAVLGDALHDRSFRRKVSRADFPPSFVFGVATSAYQIEGACKEGGKGASIWDAFSHTEVIDGSNGDVAVDHFHRHKEDIDIVSKFEFSAYRFSIAWPRIFPDGLGTNVNKEGIAFYNELINYIVEKGIEPYVTLYHWDLPSHLDESIGGWLDKQIVGYYTKYAEACFANFGNRVKNWTTISEPLQIAVGGYDTGRHAPGRCANPSKETYLAAHHMILAHAAAASLYRNKFKDEQGGKIGLIVDCEWAEASSDKVEDKDAAARHVEFQIGWFLDPLYHGNYPKVMQELLGDLLPKFTAEDKELLKSSMDFIGLNNYTARLVAHATDSSGEGHFGKAQKIQRIVKWEDGRGIGQEAASDWLLVCPWGMRKVLNYLSEKYNAPIYITANGMDDLDEDIPLQYMLDDEMRSGFLCAHLAEAAKAIKDGADVRGYFAWSLLDKFEWDQGYTKRFGLVYVDYNNGLARHPKASAFWFRKFLRGSPRDSISSDEEGEDFLSCLY